MKRLAWCTDIHLDFLDKPGDDSRVARDFAEPLSRVDADGVIISGDISLSKDIVRHLTILDAVVGKPIYFVLGNHDFYGGSFEGVRSAVRDLCSSSKNLRYLTGTGLVSLSPKIALVGDDGWYDAYHGVPERTPYIMSDWFQIADYVDEGCMRVGMAGPRPHMPKIISLSRKIAFEAVERMRASLSSAAQSHETVAVLTHVPPWIAAHRHDGKGGSPLAHPWYTSKLMGDLIEEIALSHPRTKFEVFCGHTHGHHDVQISHNVNCHVGGADYGSPQIAGTITFE